ITTGIKYANVGTICAASSNGGMQRSNRSERPAITPSGIPTSRDSPTAAKISAKVCTLCSQSPISANEANAARTPKACCQRPKRSTTSVPSATVPTQVSFWKNVVNQETRLSRNVAKPLKIAKTKLGLAALRLSLSHVWKRSRSRGSEFQTSEFGQDSVFFQPK